MKQYKEKPKEITEIKLIHGGREEDGLILNLASWETACFS